MLEKITLEKFFNIFFRDPFYPVLCVALKSIIKSSAKDIFFSLNFLSDPLSLGYFYSCHSEISDVNYMKNYREKNFNLFKHFLISIYIFVLCH